MADIFISYSQDDRPRVETIAKALEAQGWSVWWDPKILAGMTFDSVIEEALDSARCVLVIWSQNSVPSRWVRTEAGEGADRNILIPVLIDEARVPLAFRRIQTIHLTNWDGTMLHSDFNLLLQSISRLLGEPPSDNRQPAKKTKRQNQEPFEIGDIIEQYRYYNGGDYINEQEDDFIGTKWKVLDISPDYIKLELVEGSYCGTRDEYVSDFTSSAIYQKTFPDRRKTQQIIDEFRKVVE